MHNDEGLDRCYLRSTDLRQTLVMGLVSGDLGWNKRDWRLAYQRGEDHQAEVRASANTEMSVNAF